MQWYTEHQNVAPKFEILINDEVRETILYCDVSRPGIVGICHSIRKMDHFDYVSRRLNDTGGRWDVSEVELLSVMYTVTYLRPFLHFRRFPVLINHTNLQYYKHVKSLSTRLKYDGD